MAEKYINFIPGETIPLSAGTTSSSTSFLMSGSWAQRDCMISNVGNSVAFVAFHNSSSAAIIANVPAQGLTNATPVLPGETLILCKNYHDKPCDTVAAITASGTTQLFFTAGLGN